MADTKKEVPNVESNALNDIVNTVMPAVQGLELAAGLFDKTPVYDTSPEGLYTRNVPRAVNTVAFDKNDLNVDQSAHFSYGNTPSLKERLKVPSRVDVVKWSTIHKGDKSVLVAIPVSPCYCGSVSTEAPSFYFTSDSDSEREFQCVTRVEKPDFKAPEHWSRCEKKFEGDRDLSSTGLDSEGTTVRAVPFTDETRPTFMPNEHCDIIEMLKVADVVHCRHVNPSVNTSPNKINVVSTIQLKGGWYHQALESTYAYCSGGNRYTIHAGASSICCCLMFAHRSDYCDKIASSIVNQSAMVVDFIPGACVIWHPGHEPIKMIEFPQYSVNRVMLTSGENPWSGAEGSGALVDSGCVHIGYNSTIDPAVRTTASNQSPMFNYIVTREVMEDYRLYYPMPCLVLRSKYDSGEGQQKWRAFDHTMLSYFSQFFNYWRGSIIYDFEFFPSAFHQGQVYICFSPFPSAERNNIDLDNCTNLLGVTVDLSSTNKTSLTVPFVSPTEYKTTITQGNTAPNQMDWANIRNALGFLYVIVQNPLNVANPGVSNTIEFNINVRAGDDFEFRVPNSPGHGARMTPTEDLSWKNNYQYKINNKVCSRGDPWALQQIDPNSLTSLKSGPKQFEGEREGATAMSPPIREVPGYSCNSDYGVSSVGKMETASTSSIQDQWYWTSNFKVETSHARFHKCAVVDLGKTFFKASRAPSGLIKYHQFFRGDFAIKVRIATTKFVQGCVRVYFMPLKDQVHNEYDFNTYDGSYYGAQTTSQLPHVDINLCDQTEGSFIIPWPSPLHMIDSCKTECLGQIVVMIWNQMKTGTGGVTAVNGSLWMKALDSKIAVRKVFEGGKNRIHHVVNDIYCACKHAYQPSSEYAVVKQINEDLLMLRGPEKLGEGIYKDLATAGEIFQNIGKEGRIGLDSDFRKSKYTVHTGGSGWAPGEKWAESALFINTHQNFGTGPGDCGRLYTYNGRVVGYHIVTVAGESCCFPIYREMFEKEANLAGKDPLKIVTMVAGFHTYKVKEFTSKDGCDITYRASLKIGEKVVAYANGVSKVEARRQCARKYLRERHDPRDFSLIVPRITQHDVDVAASKSIPRPGEQSLFDTIRAKFNKYFSGEMKVIADNVFAAVFKDLVDVVKTHRKLVLKVLNSVVAFVLVIDILYDYCNGGHIFPKLLALAALGVSSVIIGNQAGENVIPQIVTDAITGCIGAVTGFVSESTQKLVKSTVVRELTTCIIRPIFKDLWDKVCALWRKFFPSADEYEKAVAYVKNDAHSLRNMIIRFIDVNKCTNMREKIDGTPAREILGGLMDQVVEREPHYVSARVRIHEPLFSNIKKKFQQVVSQERNNTPRMEPIGIYLVGEPGAGKSTLVDNLANAILKNTEIVEPGCDSGPHVYRMPTDPNQDYYDGYHGQPVAVYDDAFCGNESPEARKFISMISEGVHQLNMAGLEEKGQTFSSPFVVITSNTGNIERVNELAHKNAFVRRFPFCYVITPCEKFAIQRGGLHVMDKVSLTDALEKVTTYAQYCKVMDDFYTIRIFDLNKSQAGNRRSYATVVREITDCYKTRAKTFQRCSKIIKDLPVVPGEQMMASSSMLSAESIEMSELTSSNPSSDEEDYPEWDGLFDDPEESYDLKLSRVRHHLDNQFLRDIFKEQYERTHKGTFELYLSEYDRKLKLNAKQEVERVVKKDIDHVCSKNKKVVIGVVTGLAVLCSFFVGKLIGKCLYGVCQRAFTKFKGALEALLVKGREKWKHRVEEGKMIAERSRLYQELFEKLERGEIGYKGRETIPYYICNPYDCENLVALEKERGTYDPDEHKYWDEMIARLEAMGEQSLFREVRRHLRPPRVGNQMLEPEVSEHPLKANIVDIFWYAEDMIPCGQGILVDSEHLLMPMHYARHRQFKELGPLGQDRLFFKRRNVMHPFIPSEGHHIVTSEFGPIDAMIVTIPAQQGIRKRHSQFMTKQFYETHLERTDVAGKCVRRNDEFGVVVKSDTFRPAANCVTHDTKAIRIMSTECTYPGDCGSLYLVNNVCIGFHVNLSSIGNECVLGCAPIFKEYLERLCSPVVEHVERPKVVGIEQCWEGDKKGYPCLGSAIGCDDKPLNYANIPSTDYTESKECDMELWPDGFYPSLKTKKILYDRSKKYCYNKKYDAISSRENEFVRSVYKTVFDRFPERKRGILLWDEVVNGVDDIIPLRMSTSCGSWSNQASRKGCYFDQCVIDNETHYTMNLKKISEVNPRFGRSLIEQLDLRRKLGEARQSIPTYWQATIKDELLPIQKVIDHKSRVFEVPPIDSTILFKQYLGNFGEFFRTHPGPLLSHTIGTDREAVWGMLYSSLASYDPQKVICADYSQFDGSISPYFFPLFRGVVEDYHACCCENCKCWEESCMRDVLIDELKNTYMLVGDNLMSKDKGNCSGNYLTDVFNSVVNTSAWMISYARVFEDRQFRMPTVNDWWSDVVLYTHGDDCVGSLSPDSIVDADDLVHDIKELGFYMTPASKVEGDPVVSDISDVTYLKSGFRVDDPVVWPPFEKEVCYKEMNWCKRKWRDDVSVRNEQFREASKFAAYRGREFFEDFTKQMLDRIYQFSEYQVVPPKLYTYDQHRQRLYQLQTIAKNSFFGVNYQRFTTYKPP